MRRKRKSKILLIFILILFVGIGFASLTSYVDILTSLQVKGKTWDVHFENPQLTGNGVTADVPTITDDGLTVNFSCTILMRKDYFEFTVDAVNDGDLDAEIEEITYAQGSTDYIDYEIKDSNGDIVRTGRRLATGKKATYTIRVTYKEDAVRLSEDTSTNLGITFKYKKAQGRPKSATSVDVTLVDGRSTPTYGDLIKIGETEQFYIIGINDETATLFAKNNLIVNTTNGATEDMIGKQRPDDSTVYQVVPFSTSAYWKDTYTSGKYGAYDFSNWQDQYIECIYDPDYADAPGSNNYSIAYYVNMYIEYLESIGLANPTGRLINHDEFLAANCKLYSSCGTSFFNTDYDNVYWTGIGASSNDIIFHAAWGMTPATYSYSKGVRPVIEVPLSTIQSAY